MDQKPENPNLKNNLNTIVKMKNKNQTYRIFRVKNALMLVLLALALGTKAQVGAPASKQTKPVWIYGATIHIGDGKVLKNANVRFENGSITNIDTDKPDLSKAEYDYINAQNKHVYPGLIAPNTTVGLNEIDAVRSTRDHTEVGENNANVRSIIAYNTDSKIIPTLRSNGLLLVQVTPSGGSISGSSSIVQLDAWNWEDAAVKTDDALHINWPFISLSRGRNAEQGENEKQQFEKEIKAIEEIFTKAQAYCLSKPLEINLKLEAFREVLTKKRKVFIHTNGAREMIRAVQSMQKFGITPVIVGGTESYLIAGFLRDHNVGVILLGTQNLPSLPEEDIDMPYKLPKILKDSGVLFCLADNGAWQQRNLPFQAGTAVAFGLSSEEALMSVTKNTSEILGIDTKYGTLAIGKSATLIISEGDVLDTRTSIVTDAWIDGRKIDVNTHQKDLDAKYRKKYFGE